MFFEWGEEQMQFESAEELRQKNARPAVLTRE
jgi:hypothetical protein